MPGIIVFRRRWSVGSDDLVVPGALLFLVHLVWVVILGVLLGILEFDENIECIKLFWNYVIGYMAIFVASMTVEFAMCLLATRGSILDTAPRAPMQYLLYVRLFILIVEASWLTAGVFWIKHFYQSCPVDQAKEIMIALVVSNCCVLGTVVVTVWCVYDAAGRSWVKMKKYQRSMREAETRGGRLQKRSGSRNRNWRQRKVIRAYQDSWDSRCRILFCCIGKSDRNRNSFTDIAKLLSEFFRDLDVVPSDVVAGLVLLRKFQKIERELIVKQRKNDTYEFLSGVPVTPRTKFLSLTEDGDLEHFQDAIHYMHFALAAYGWPLYLVNHSSGLCHLCSGLRCCCFPCCTKKDDALIVEDNCCQCNYAALRKMVKIGDVEVVYATFHVDVGETPFFVALDHTKKKVVVSIRGTLSMKDVMTDLNAESEVIPLSPPREDWLGHKGMVQAAGYIRKKLSEEEIITKALEKNPSRGTKHFGLTLVGHSLGAGTAAILAILLKQEYPDLTCFSFAPPGGLLSMPAQEYTQEFITSVVVGKDVIPRIGLRQMESLRADLINAIKRSVDPKWKTITCSVMCCGCGTIPTSAANLEAGGCISEYQREKDLARSQAVVPNDSTIALSLHRPLYPPGKIIHVVRHHPIKGERVLNKNEPVYQALWAGPQDFDEVLISPVMIQDHMPDNMLKALNKVLEYAMLESGAYISRTSLAKSFEVFIKRSKSTENSNQLGDFTADTPPLSCHITRLSRAGDWSTLNRLAPLATPETLSEASTSSPPSPLPQNIRPIRRTPKIQGNLANAADDLKNNLHFAMLSGKNIHLRDQLVIGSNSSSANSEISYDCPKGPPPPVPRRRDSIHIFMDQRVCTGPCCKDDNSDSSPHASSRSSKTSQIQHRVQIDYVENDHQRNGNSLEFYDQKCSTLGIRDLNSDVFLSLRSSPECRNLMGPAVDVTAEWKKRLDCGGDNSLPLLRGLSPIPGHQSVSPFFNTKRKKYVYPISLVGRGESSV